MHRYQSAVYEQDFFVDANNADYVVHFPDPPDSSGWPNKKVPRRGISFFRPLNPTEPHGKPAMVSADVPCSVLSETSLRDGWRFVFDRDMKFRTSAGDNVTVGHFLLYTSVEMTVENFQRFTDGFTFLPCTLNAAAEPYMLGNDFDSEQGQASSFAVIALRILKYLCSSGQLTPMHHLLAVDLHTNIAEKKKPLQYMKTSRVENLAHIISRYSVISQFEDGRRDLLNLLDQIVRSVRAI